MLSISVNAQYQKKAELSLQKPLPHGILAGGGRSSRHNLVGKEGSGEQAILPGYERLRWKRLLLKNPELFSFTTEELDCLSRLRRGSLVAMATIIWYNHHDPAKTPQEQIARFVEETMASNTAAQFQRMARRSISSSSALGESHNRSDSASSPGESEPSDYHPSLSSEEEIQPDIGEDISPGYLASPDGTDLSDTVDDVNISSSPSSSPSISHLGDDLDCGSVEDEELRLEASPPHKTRKGGKGKQKAEDQNEEEEEEEDQKEKELKKAGRRKRRKGKSGSRRKQREEGMKRS